MQLSMRSVAAEAVMERLVHHRQLWLVEMLAAQARLVSCVVSFFSSFFICCLCRFLSPNQVT